MSDGALAAAAPQPTSPSYPHVTVQERLAQIDASNHGSKRVTILGAGMAGLAAARELARLGHDVEVLEGSERLGGRVNTTRFDDGSYAELGAMRIPQTHDYTHHYVQQLGLQLQPFVNSLPENFCDLRGQVVRAADAKSALMPTYDLPAALADLPSGGAVFGTLLDHAVDSLTAQEMRDLFTANLSTELLRSFESMSLGEFLHKVAGPGARAAVADFTCLEPFWDLSLGVFLREELQDTSDNLTTLVGGMSTLPTKLAEAVQAAGVPIHLHVEVLDVTVLADGRVELALRDHGVLRTQVCDHVLCTLPFSVMRRLNLVGFSQTKLDAINNLNYVSAYKLALHCQQRFWETTYGIHGGASVSDQIYRQVYYPQDNLEVATQPAAPEVVDGKAKPADQFAGTGKGRGSVHTTTSLAYQTSRRTGAPTVSGGALLVYNWGQDAVRLGHLTHERQVEVSLARIERIHPEVRDYYQQAHGIAWDAHEWTSGAFSLWRPGQLAELWAGVVQNEGRLRFAGEHCSTDNGWIQGSLESALRAVLDIVAAP